MVRTASLLSSLLILAASPIAHAGVIADSVAEFSGVQGQDNWSYGIFNQGAPPALATYSAAGFEEFDLFTTDWRASNGLVGANNNEFLNINDQGGHPTGIGPGSQDRVLWAIRRYESEVSGAIEIAYDLRKRNIINPDGGGITGRIFVDGVEVFSQFIANADGIGVQGSIIKNVNVGSKIDFVIDPLGMTPPNSGDDNYSARADGSIFSAVISDSAVPEPSTFAIGGGLFVCCLGLRKRRRNQTQGVQNGGS